MEWTITNILKLAILLVIAFFVGLFLLKGYPAINYILNYGEEEIIKDTPEDVSEEFQNIVSDFEACFNSDDDNCICNIKILRFPTDYTLSFNGENTIEIVNPTRKMVINKNSYTIKDGKITNCFITYDNKINIKKVDGSAYLFLDMDPKLLFKKYQDDILTLIEDKSKYMSIAYNYKDRLALYATKGNIQDDAGYFFLDNEREFYKSGNNICFILKPALSTEGRDYIKTLPKCSPKPLNSKL